MSIQPIHPKYHLFNIRIYMELSSKIVHVSFFLYQIFGTRCELPTHSASQLGPQLKATRVAWLRFGPRGSRVSTRNTAEKLHAVPSLGMCPSRPLHAAGSREELGAACGGGDAGDGLGEDTPEPSLSTPQPARLGPPPPHPSSPRARVGGRRQVKARGGAGA